jgi:hypothetical protein
MNSTDGLYIYTIFMEIIHKLVNMKKEDRYLLLEYMRNEFYNPNDENLSDDLCFIANDILNILNKSLNYCIVTDSQVDIICNELSEMYNIDDVEYISTSINEYINDYIYNLSKSH